MSKIVRLGDIASLITKGTTPTTLGFQFQESGINFIKIESISENGAFLQNKFEHISEECDKKLNRSRLKENDILFSIAGALGRTAVVTKSILPANTNQALAIIRLEKENINFKYVQLALKSNSVYKQFQNQKQGVAQLNLSLKNISDLEIPLPPLEIQKQIADTLDKTSELIELRKKKLEELDKLIKSVFYDMFGDPVKNEKGWGIKKLCDICDVRDGTHDSPKYKTNGFPLITSKNISSGKIDFSTINYISKEDFEKINKRSKVDSGDIIMPMIGTIGNPIIVREKRNFAIKNVALIKFNNENVRNTYIKELLSSNYFEIITKHNSRGGTQKFISLTNIRNLLIPLPPIKLQNKFAQIIEKIEEQKQVVQKAIDETQIAFNSLMSKYFE